MADLVADGTRDTAGAERIAVRFADAAHLLVVASGADRPAGRELVLKVEEAAWLPSAYRDLETFLHGHLPATGEGTGLVLILTDRDRRAERLARARQALAAAKVIGLRSAAIVASGVDAELDPVLTPAGRLVIAEAPDLPGARRRVARQRDPAPAPDRAARPGPRHEPRPDPAGGPGLSRGRGRRGSLSAADRQRSARRRDRPTALELPDERLAHQVDHVEVPRQQVLEHEPLDARPPRTGAPARAPPRACR